ncbi:MAG: sugar phosphate nucleotidyltransferase [Candidatus Bipolaricaulaceae bacterium]
MRTVVLAGGFAKRLWPITLDRPKPLLPVAGKPILDYIMDRYPLSDPPILSVNRRFTEAFSGWSRAKGRQVELVVEETRSEEEKLGSVGALAYVIDRLSLDDDLLVVGGDNLFDFDLGEFVNSFHGETLVALYDLGDPARARRRYGVALVEGGRVKGFQEKPDHPRSQLASTACYVFPRQVLPLIRTFLAQAEAGQDAPGYFLEWLRARKPIDAFVFGEGWFDVGGRSAYIEANLHYHGGRSWVHPRARLEGACVERSVVIGPCRIEGARLTGCVVDEDAQITGVDLRDALVGRGSWLRGDD